MRRYLCLHIYMDEFENKFLSLRSDKPLVWLRYIDDVFFIWMFYPGPMVSFRSARKVSSYLVRAKVYPLERTVGSFKCKKSRCQVCLNVNETDTFTSTVTKKTYKINHKFDCSDKCLIYLLTCKKCLIQYVGKV